MFESIKIVRTLGCVQNFAPKSQTNVRKSKLPCISLTKMTFYFLKTNFNLKIVLRSDIKDFI